MPSTLDRRFGCPRIRGLLVWLVLGSHGAVAAEATPPIPRTREGRPDLDGVWSFATLTPLQRPPELVATPFLTPAQADELLHRMLAEYVDRPRPDVPPDSRALSRQAFNEFWSERGTSLAMVRGRILSSLIIDPPDGRMPGLTPAGEARAAEQDNVMLRDSADDPEQRRLSERCLASHAGPPLLPSGDTNLVRLVQTSTHLVVAAEASGDARIVSTDGRSTELAGVVAWRGISSGEWVSDTLVVDTHQVRAGAALASSRVVTGVGFHLVERFTLLDSETLLYEFTVDDPDTFVRSWTALLPMKRTTSRIFEYACHEGNYSLAGILRGARFQEKIAAHPN